MPVPRPPEPPTSGIDRDLRLAILKWAAACSLPADRLWQQYANVEGHGTVPGALSRVSVRYGLADTLAEQLRGQLAALAASAHDERDALTVEPSPEDRQTALDQVERLAILLLPDEEFLVLLEAAPLGLSASPPVSWTGKPKRERPSVLDYAGQLLTRRGLPWSASQQDGVQWVGSQATQRPLVQAAEKAVTHPLLAGAQDEWRDARLKLRAGDPKSLEDAVEESAKAVESSLKALMAAHGVAPPRNQQALPMFERLTDPAYGSVLPGYLNSMLTAAANVRNQMGGHGAGPTPRTVPRPLADAVFAAASTALVLLETYLP